MNGFLIIDKEKARTSRDIDNELMHLLNTKKIGHLGTLDPLATGVLVIAVGDALKVISLVEAHKKKYEATIKVGLQTDTLDITGNVLASSDKRISKEALTEVLDSLLGDNMLAVPKYSAVKVAGKKLYEYARNNEEVVLPKKNMTVLSYSLLSFGEDEFKVELLLSYGAYVRSIIDEIGKRLSVPMTMSELRRTASGDFLIEDALAVDQITAESFLSIETVLKDFNTVNVDPDTERRILHGQILDNAYGELPVVFKSKSGEVIAIYKLYDKDPAYIKPHKIIAKVL